MPLGIINSEQFNKELERFKLPIKSELDINANDDLEPSVLDADVIDQKIGRGDKLETPEPVRNLIAINAIGGATHKELSETFNVSESSVSAYKHGATSTATYNEPNKNLLKNVNAVKDKIVRRANKRILSALDAITSDAMEDMKPRDLATMAKDLSSVVRNMTPETKEINQDVRVVVMAPPMKSIDQYEIIEANE